MRSRLAQGPSARAAPAAATLVGTPGRLSSGRGLDSTNAPSPAARSATAPAARPSRLHAVERPVGRMISVGAEDAGRGADTEPGRARARRSSASSRPLW